MAATATTKLVARARKIADAPLPQARHEACCARENAIIHYKGAQLNLIGVDYQRERGPSGRKQQMLPNFDPLVRRDMPNILLSHIRTLLIAAAELGVEAFACGHTHGGRCRSKSWTSASARRLRSPIYIAGLYHRPLLMPDQPKRMGETIKLMPNAPTASPPLRKPWPRHRRRASPPRRPGNHSHRPPCV